MAADPGLDRSTLRSAAQEAARSKLRLDELARALDEDHPIRANEARLLESRMQTVRDLLQKSPACAPDLKRLLNEVKQYEEWGHALDAVASALLVSAVVEAR